MTHQASWEWPVRTRLTSALRGCDRETGEGQEHVGSKAPKGDLNIRVIHPELG